MLRAELCAGGINLDLELRDILPPWQPGDGVARPTSDATISTSLALPSPWSSVSGTASVDGRTTHVEGLAYSNLT
jgi:hypothetical protein